MHAFVHLMQRYIEDYCNHHDMTVCHDIMAPEYTVHIAGRHHTGRDEKYIPAASAAFGNFPDLRLTVHELRTNGDRLVMRFSERGTNKETGRLAAWGGIGLYDWNGEQLTANWVEQDYASRRRQVEGESGADPLDELAAAPWMTQPVAADPAIAAFAEEFLRRGDLLAVPKVAIDESWLTGSPTVPITPTSVEIDDLFSVGDRVAAHLRLIDGSRELNVAAILHVAAGEVIALRAVTDRLAMAERG